MPITVSDVNGSYENNVKKQRRTKFEIYLQVLLIIRKGTKKPTKIMYEANISWKPLIHILKSMMKQGLLKKIETKSNRAWKSDKRSKHFYILTQKGENVIKHFRRTSKILKKEDLTMIPW